MFWICLIMNQRAEFTINHSRMLLSIIFMCFKFISNSWILQNLSSWYRKKDPVLCVPWQSSHDLHDMQHFIWNLIIYIQLGILMIKVIKWHLKKKNEWRNVYLSMKKDCHNVSLLVATGMVSCTKIDYGHFKFKISPVMS